MIKKLYYTCIATLLLAGSAVAQEATVLDEINVEATSVALEQREFSPAAKVVVEREEIKRMEDRTVGDILRRMPGISYSGPPGVTKDVRMRGMDKGYTQILINGERVGSAKSDRQMQVNRIPADMIERIEIIRTPTADIDSQGVGGTINIILKQSEKKPFGQLRVGAGYTGKKPSGKQRVGELGFQMGGGSESFNYLFNISKVERAENKGEDKKKYKGDGSLSELTTKVETSNVSDLSIAPRFSWQTDIGKITLDPFYIRTEENKSKIEDKFKGDGSANGSKLEDEVKLNEISRLRLGLERKYSDTFTLKWRITAQKASEKKDKDVQELKADGSLKKTSTEKALNKETEYSTAVEGKWLSGDSHLVKLGAELRDRKSMAEKTTYEDGTLKTADAKDLYTINEQRKVLYGSDEWLIAENHLLTSGVRFEFYETTAQQGDSDKNSNSDVQTNPSLNYRYQPTRETVIRAGVARTLKSPKLDELNPYLSTSAGTVTKPDTGGNPDLKPESSIGYDVGLEHYFSQRKGVLGMNFFYRDISDLIESETKQEDGRWVSRPENVGKARLSGAELDLSRKLDFLGLPNLKLWGNYTWLESKVISSDGDERTIKDVPDYIYNVGFDQKIPTWKFEFGVVYNILGPINSDAPKDNLTEVKTEDSKRLVDLYARKKFNDGWQLSMTAYNIFEDNKRVEKHIFNEDGSLKESETKLETSVRTVMITLVKKW